MGELQERYWTEYRGRFGEPELPMPDMGLDMVGIELRSDGSTEYLEISGAGFRPQDIMPGGRGMSRVQLILNELGKYNVEHMIVRRKW